MNNGPTDTLHPHLDLDDLIAQTGQPVESEVRDHLAGCERCRVEASRWSLVADAVRALTTTAPDMAPPASPQRTRQHGQRPLRRALLGVGGAAAALVLVLGIGALTGDVHVQLSGPSTDAVLTAVTGCNQIVQASGTLQQVNGGNVVIQTASGHPVTVTTTGSTLVSTSGALLNDITDGASVVVRGYSSHGTIRAAIVTVGQPFSAVNPPGFVPLQGTVSDASTAGFTLVMSTGARVPVTTSGDTLVIVPHASLSQLRGGSSIFALGEARPDGTLSARALGAVTQVTSGAHVSMHARMSVRDCSSRSLVEALGAISVTAASAR